MKQNIAVIYKSKYGSTKKYAAWIAHAVNADLFEYSKFQPKDFSKYDIIVFGGYLHSVGISGLDIIKMNMDLLKGKKIIVFSVGAAPIQSVTLQSVRNGNFTKEESKNMQFFGLRGAFNFQKLQFIDKTMMRLLRFMIKRKKAKELDEDSKGLLAVYDHPADWTDKDTIQPIVKAILE
jgi:menaquinone-dependent protoporphyrinogen IX oxidase